MLQCTKGQRYPLVRLIDRYLRNAAERACIYACQHCFVSAAGGHKALFGNIIETNQDSPKDQEQTYRERQDDRADFYPPFLSRPTFCPGEQDPGQYQNRNHQPDRKQQPDSFVLDLVFPLCSSTGTYKHQVKQEHCIVANCQTELSISFFHSETLPPSGTSPSSINRYYWSRFHPTCFLGFCSQSQGIPCRGIQKS